MPPPQPSAAEPGVRRPHGGPSRAGSGRELHDEAVSVLLVGKRSTARELGSALPSGRMTQEPNDSVALEAKLGAHKQIHLTAVTNQRAALQHIKAGLPRAIFVELDNRPESRVRFCRLLRSRAPAAAIFAVGHRRPQGSLDCDGFVALPLTEARMENALEALHDHSPGHVLECGPFTLELGERTLHTPDGPRHLTPKLCALLEFLIAHREKVVSRSEIMESIWQTSYLEDTRTLDVHVRWLRKSMEPDPSSPRYLLTERGIGYRLCCCAPAIPTE